MASIYERKKLNGEAVYRVKLVKKGIPSMSVTFYDYEEAVEWVLKNEMEYYKNPDKFREWKEQKYIENMKNRYSQEKKIIITRTRY